MKSLAKIITILFFLLYPSLSYAKILKPPYISDSQSYEIESFTAADKDTLSTTSIKIFDLDKNTFRILQKGQGHINEYDNTHWTIESLVMNADGYLQTLNSTCEISDTNGNVLAVYKKIYSHTKKTITWEHYSLGELVDTKIFPIKGKTADDTTMSFFIKSYIPSIEDKDNYFYLLTNEPKLYKTKVSFLQNELLDLPIGLKTATKIKLTADIGIIDDILDKYVPQTFLWYESTPPYSWLKYQGYESGYESLYIKSIRIK